MNQAVNPTKEKEDAELEGFVGKLRAKHKELTSNFVTAQAAQRAATKGCREHRDALVAFRQKYGRMLQAIEAGDGSISVQE